MEWDCGNRSYQRRKAMNRRHQRIVERVLGLPTAPFAEGEVLAHIREFCAEREIARLTQDKHGNLLVRVKKGILANARPICITAHVDHPGFVAHRMVENKKLEAHWRGGVMVEYFQNQRVRFHTNDGLVVGRVVSMTTKGEGDRQRADVVTLSVPREVPPGSLGMWDLQAPSIENGRITAPACDDLAGVAALLCTIDDLERSKKPCNMCFLFTRAEEVGFVGAMAVIRSGTVPKKCMVIVTETSSELPHARIGDGPILRVGDRVTSFTSAATGFCNEVAGDLAKKSKSFKIQRRLMDGGMCEATAFCTLGHDATCICLALGNYHNMDKKSMKIAPEYVAENDFNGLVEWYVALAQTERRYTGKDAELVKKLAGIEKEYRALLASTARTLR